MVRSIFCWTGRGTVTEIGRETTVWAQGCRAPLPVAANGGNSLRYGQGRRSSPAQQADAGCALRATASDAQQADVGSTAVRATASDGNAVSVARAMRAVFSPVPSP